MLLMTLNSLIINDDKAVIDLAKQKQIEYQTPNKHYVVIVDYSKPIEDVRLFVVDMDKSTVVLRSTVAHAFNSGFRYATDFSNQMDSKKSSIGAYQTLGTYFGGFGYSMRIKGLESINNNAERRLIIFHSNKLMRTAWSYGCFATPEETNKKIIDLVKNGCLVYVKR